MLNLFKSQVQSLNQIKFSQSHDLWNDLSLDESSSYMGGKLIWRDPELGWCRRGLDGYIHCRYREPGIR